MSPTAKFWDCPRCGKNVKSWCSDCFKNQDQFRYVVIPGTRERKLRAARESQVRNADQRAEYVSEWQKRNAERVNRNGRSYRDRHPDRVKARHKRDYWERGGKELQKDWRLKKNYGLSLEDFRALVEVQEGRCRICRDWQPEERLHVDHDHGTGYVRGLLCAPCNRGLGQFRDRKDVMLAAIEYLEEAEQAEQMQQLQEKAQT